MTEWDRHAATWDRDEAARAYARAAFDSLGSALTNRGLSLDGARVCDFGCGTGLLAELVAGGCARIDAVDTSLAMLGVLEAKIEDRGWPHVQATTDLPTSNTSHDLVLCSSVCAFLDDYPGTVRKLVALLRPGGIFVQWDWELDDTDADPHGLSRGAIRDALASAGLESISVATGFELEFDGQTMSPLMGVGQKPAATIT